MEFYSPVSRVPGVAGLFHRPQLSISLFYLLPVSLASWSLSIKPGCVIALISALVLQGSNILAGEQFSPSIVLWNTVASLGIFLIFAVLVSELHSLLEQQTELSHTDSLIGVLIVGYSMRRLAANNRTIEVLMD